MTTFTESVSQLTRHAGKRMQQRAIQQSDVGLVLVFGDLVKAVGDGTDAISLTRETAAGLVADGRIPPGGEARLARITVLVIRDTGVVRTVLWRQGRAGRRYTRGATLH